MSAEAQTPNRKERRNVSLDSELNNWLSSREVSNASGLIEQLLYAYRAYGDAVEAAEYVESRRNV